MYAPLGVGALRVSVGGFLRRPWRPAVFQGIAFVGITAYFLLLYVVPPIRFYNIFWLQNFDYGIFYNSSQMLAHLQAPFVTTRGTHSWADHQKYFELLLVIFHHLPYPHYSLLVSHSLAIFACGVFCFLYLRREGLVALLLPLAVWMSPYLVNMNLDLFHTEAYATILLLFMFYGATHGRPRCFAIATLLALACKEDVAITVGAFMALALLRPGFFQLQRRYLVAGLAASVLVFVINQGVVLPYFKLRTCEWLNADISPSNMRAGPYSPWFPDTWSQLLNPSYFRTRFASPGVTRYLLTLLWPVVFFARSTFPISLLPLPGAFINIIGSGYLIQSAYHYDHSTYAAVIIVMLLGLRRARFKKSLGTVLVLIAAWINLNTPLVRVKVTAVRTPEFWKLEKDERTRFVEHLNELLPPHIVISADYSAVNYLLRGRDTVYMFENPFRPDYFGIYGLCDGVVGVYRTVPTPDIAVVRGDYTISPKVREILDTAYEKWTVYLSGGRYPMNLFINPRSKQYGRLVSVARELGATAPAAGRGEGSGVAGWPWRAGVTPWLHEKHHPGRYEIVRRLVADRGRQLLDAGCGPPCETMQDGGFLRFLGYGLGVDVERRSVPFPFVQGDIQVLPFRTDAFEVVTCIEVFEHVHHPTMALDELARVLADHGPEELLGHQPHHAAREALSEPSARLSTLYIGVSGNLGSTVRPSSRFELASSAPTKARRSASVGGAARSAGPRPSSLNSDERGGTPWSARSPFLRSA